MKRISMVEFGRICEEYGPAVISFDTENQDGLDFPSIDMTLLFTGMSMMFNPNRICLKGDSGTICFNRVKSINHYDESNAFGMVFGIVCGNGFAGNKEVVYKIIVDKKYKL